MNLIKDSTTHMKEEGAKIIKEEALISTFKKN